MTIAELGTQLGEMYRTAPDGRAVAMIHLFGIRYADALRASGASMKEIALAAGISENYATEIGKGFVLAEYVVPKSLPTAH